LNNIPKDHDLQHAQLEKMTEHKDNSLTVEEIRTVFILSFERLSMKSTKNDEREELEEQELFSGQFKGYYRYSGKINNNSFQYKNRSKRNGGNNGNTTERNHCYYCRKLDNVRQNCIK
jgi:hypothetical protein